MSKTVIFEEKYGVNIDQFSTTEDIEKFIEHKTDRKLQIIKLDDHGIVFGRSSIFKIGKYDIDHRFDETIKDHKKRSDNLLKERLATPVDTEKTDALSEHDLLM